MGTSRVSFTLNSYFHSTYENLKLEKPSRYPPSFSFYLVWHFIKISTLIPSLQATAKQS
uniref:Uncharacterized protein n=1 Tax=Kuenenia stuttgartiensis TaxID=174633 RepID=Q1Q0Z3_KUEST|nr:unknown protein [Candidatus Kuenenia stuttgartiensis]